MPFAGTPQPVGRAKPEGGVASPDPSGAAVPVPGRAADSPEGGVAGAVAEGVAGLLTSVVEPSRGPEASWAPPAVRPSVSGVAVVGAGTAPEEDGSVTALDPSVADWPAGPDDAGLRGTTCVRAAASSADGSRPDDENDMGGHGRWPGPAGPPPWPA